MVKVSKSFYRDSRKIQYSDYGESPKILNTNVSDKMPYANSADPDHTAPEGAV